jgi:L,D-peptidoglycan transpeptidase YkuD (ErfK/YbiS/YcfS/YnhG family)
VIAKPGDLVIGKWRARYCGQTFPCAVGRGGIGIKVGEGDGITPVGRWRITGGGYRADRLVAPSVGFAMHQIGPGDIWSDDADDPDYNHHVVARAHPYSFENLRRADPLYDIYAILDFNWPVAIPGRGSAIFLHAWRKPRHPTEGCVAFAPNVLRYILESWQLSARVIIKN